MKSLKTFLTAKGFVKIPLVLTNTNHFEIKAEINGIEGRFILDTGASSTCVGTDCAQHFNLSTEDSEVRAAGAGGNNMETRISRKNSISIGTWSRNKIKLVLFDLSHVNEALLQHDSLPVHGIIGADIMKKARAIIDYDKKCVYLKKGRQANKVKANAS